MLSKYVKKDRIILNITALGYEQMLKVMLTRSNRKNYTHIIDAILKRESLMPTALGKGIALPRLVLDDGLETELIIAISSQGIDLNSLDRLPVKIILLYLFSKNDDYPAILAQSLRGLNDDSLKTGILKATKEDEIVRLIKFWEEE
jgi:PTS system nitrogen regulatory IIA component